MVVDLYNFLLEIPKVIAEFGNWLVTPLHEELLPLSPLALFGVGGVSVVIVIFVVHIVKLFL